jgi:class 3 adenylate cyclase
MLLSRLSIQSKLILMLLVVCIGSIVAISVIAFSTGKETLTQAIFNELTSVRSSKKYQIESQFKLIRNEVVNLSNDPTVTECLLGLRANFASFTDLDVKPDWDEKIKAYYEDDFLPKLAQKTGKHPILDAYLPRTAAARYLQYQYIANNPNPSGEKYKLVDAKDGSGYSIVHARFHPMLAKLVRDFGYSNLFLIDNKGNAVYTCTKSPIFGTNLLLGPYSNTNVAEMFRGLIGAKDQDTVKLVDFMRIDSALGAPVALIGSPVFDGPNQIGVVAIQLPVDEINRVATGNYGWEREGLGKTGEVILVGSDSLLRSRSRLLYEDKDKYFAQLEKAGYSKADIDQVRQAGTALLAQYARIKAVDHALSGEQGTDIENDYRGLPTLVSYAPLEIEGLRWVIVASMETSEAFKPLYHLTWTILCWSVLIVLVVTVLAMTLAHLFVRPIYRLADGVKQFKAGKTDVTVDFTSQDEYQDLSMAFNEMTQSIHKQTAQLREQEQKNNKLLLNLVPPAVAARLANGERDVAQRYSDVTVLVARLAGFTEATESFSAEKTVGLLDDLITAFDEAAERHRAEKLKTSGYTYVAVCGMSEQLLDHSKRMVEFAMEIVQILSRFKRESNINIDVRIGLDTGPVTGGVIGRSKLTYDLFGETVDNARGMMSESPADIILVSQTVYDSLHDLYGFYGPFQVRGAGDGVVAWALKTSAQGALRLAQETTDGAAQPDSNERVPKEGASSSAPAEPVD